MRLVLFQLRCNVSQFKWKNGIKYLGAKNKMIRIEQQKNSRES